MVIICELSGGADSILSTIRAKERWPEAWIIGVFVDYGQICRTQEYSCAVKAARKIGVDYHRIILRNVWTGGGMISGETDVNSTVYTPLRNVAILGSVTAFAESKKANIIITGSKGLTREPEKEYSYYDSTLPFYKLMQGVWAYATENKRIVQIIPILAEGRRNKMTKEEVYSALLKHGFGFYDTWSCFKGNPQECGECHNCQEKIRIFKKFKEEKK